MKDLILLHGALGSRAQFGELKALLSGDFKVYDFNFSGHGGSPVDKPFSIDLFVRDTLAFMDGHHLETAHFFGYSMGGYVALKLAHDFPGRADQIITLGTKFLWDPQSAAKEVRMMNPDIIEQKIPAYAASLAERHKPADWKAIMRNTADMMTELGAGKAMTTKEFGEIGSPVLVCIGSDDHMVTISESEFTAQHLKIGRLEIIEGFKHPLEAVDKQILAAMCIDFMK